MGIAAKFLVNGDKYPYHPFQVCLRKNCPNLTGYLDS